MTLIETIGATDQSSSVTQKRCVRRCSKQSQAIEPLSPTIALPAMKKSGSGKGHDANGAQIYLAAPDPDPVKPKAISTVLPTSPVPLAPISGAEAAMGDLSPIADVPLSATIAAIRELYAHRVATIRQQNRIGNGCRALVGRSLGFSTMLPAADRKKINEATKALIKAIQAGDEIKPEQAAVAGSVRSFCLMSREMLRPSDNFRANLEAELERLAKLTPGADFVATVSGFSWGGLYTIIGEAGDLSNYANPAKLWKRLGLAVIGGRSQRKCTDKAEAEEQGYNPRRRSAIWTIADSLLKADNPYRQIYRDRCAYECARNPEFLNGKTRKDGSPSVTKHCDRRARRYAEKRLVLNLWQAWNKAA